MIDGNDPNFEPDLALRLREYIRVKAGISPEDLARWTDQEILIHVIQAAQARNYAERWKAKNPGRY